jgi:hypothetical protein
MEKKGAKLKDGRVSKEKERLLINLHLDLGTCRERTE